jgi:hypothetical protein
VFRSVKGFYKRSNTLASNVVVAVVSGSGMAVEAFVKVPVKFVFG